MAAVDGVSGGGRFGGGEAWEFLRLRRGVGSFLAVGEELVAWWKIPVRLGWFARWILWAVVGGWRGWVDG